MARSSNRRSPESTAKSARLHYRGDSGPGITRKTRDAAGKRPLFAYFDRRGRQITDEQTVARVDSLAIPPAWRDVWINPDPRGHLQATGRDQRGRKQYRYHPEFRSHRESAKYHRMLAFARVLPRIRRVTSRHLSLPGLPREKVLAAVVRIMQVTFIRVGNDQYARDNGTYGLTTLLDEHAEVKGKRVHFEFRGKSGVHRQIDLDDPRLARIVKACRDLPQEQLFAYTDEDGAVRDVTSADVNAYLAETTGSDFTAKDFRTWAGTVLACAALRELPCATAKTVARRHVAAAIKAVAGQLGNTPAVCRKNYIHPAVIEAYEAGALMRLTERAAEQLPVSGLQADERTTLRVIRSRLRKRAVGQ